MADMVAMLRHRGPDAYGIHTESGAALGHARLSIIDIAGGGQPMSNEDGSIWVTFNGEIFNYIELRAELAAKGHRFRTRSDTEVLVHLYEEEGLAGVSRLNGQWAFAIWDARTRTLSLSRDRLGVRPLFYTIVGGQLLFASEMKALFADPRVSREINPRGLDDIFTFWSPLPPRTIFRDVRELPPGHSLTWQHGRCTIEPHWRPAFEQSSEPRSVDEWTEMLDALLTDATNIRLRSDVPVGAYLSGGLDSSVVTTLATRVADAPPRTFSTIRNSTRACTSVVSRGHSGPNIASCAARPRTSARFFPTSCGTRKRRSCAPRRRRSTCSRSSCASADAPSC